MQKVQKAFIYPDTDDPAQQKDALRHAAEQFDGSAKGGQAGVRRVIGTPRHAKHTQFVSNGKGGMIRVK